MIDRVDIFVFLDDVQFIKREWKNRNRIRKFSTANDALWLSVPIQKNTQHDKMIHAFPSDHHDWCKTHIRSMLHTYRHTPYYTEIHNKIFNNIRIDPGESLADLNIRIIISLSKIMGINTVFLRSSSLKQPGSKSDKLLNLCKEIGAKHYIANNRSENYLERTLFTDAGINLEYQNYEHPVYDQWFHKEKLLFISHLSIVDLLFNQGRDNSLRIVQSGRMAGVLPG
jgi:hypothetical protein